MKLASENTTTAEQKNFVKLKEIIVYQVNEATGFMNCLHKMENQERYWYQIFGADNYTDVIKNFQ